MASLSSSLAATKASRFRWFVAALFFVIYTIAAADRANIGFALPFIRKEFAMTNTEAGALLSLFLWGYALMQIPSGFAMKTFGVRRLFAVAMVLTSLFTGLMGTINSIGLLKFYRFALGLVEAPLPIGITTTINNWFPPEEKGTASGIFLSSVKFGPVIVPPLCGLIVSFWGWREIFYICAVPGLLLAVAWWFLVPNNPSDSPFCSDKELEHIADATIVQKAEGQAQRRSFAGLDRLIRTREVEPLKDARAIFRSWNVWGCALGYSFQLGISNVLLAWIPTYLLVVKKYSIMSTSFVAAAPWVGAVVGNIVGGWLSDRLLDKRRKPGMLFSALATAGMMYALINSPADPTQYALLLFVTGVMLSIGFSAYMAYPMGLVAKDALPVAISVVNMGGQIGGAAAPLAVGALLDGFGWDYAFLFMAIGSLMSFLFVAAIEEPMAQRLPQSPKAGA
jgi:sugar phosphate permease